MSQSAAPPFADFLGVVFPQGTEGFIELRALPSHARAFLRPDNVRAVQRFISDHPIENIFFGVAARRTEGDGSLANCGMLRALWVDLDFKALPETEARVRLAHFPLHPSIIIRSGHGLHVYWLFREAVDLSTDAQRIKDLLRRLARHLGADLQTAEPARVLRVPGTSNHKDEPPRPVEVELFEPQRRYNPSEFEWLFPEGPGGDGHGQRFMLTQEIREGYRNSTLYRLARRLKAEGLSHPEILATLRTLNQTRCIPPLSEGEIVELSEKAVTQPDRPDFQGLAERPDPKAVPVWRLYDGADPWDFSPVEHLVEGLLPLRGITWWGGLPKRYKSLLLLYVCLCIACRRGEVTKHFKIHTHPKILYVAREDGGSRLQDRRNDILTPWGVRLEPGAIRFLIRPRLDLLNSAHIEWLRQTCVREGVTLLVLDTWTALSPSADPMGARDQARLADVIRQLCEDIAGQIIVVDHSRKNRPEGQPLSSADIFGPPQKWAAAEHIVMLDLTSDGKRLEVFVEGKDVESTRFFLVVSPRGSGEEKFTYAGTVAEIAQAQRELGERNREAVLQVLHESWEVLSAKEVVEALGARGLPLVKDTVQRHLARLVEDGLVQSIGRGRATKYSSTDAAVSREREGAP